MERAFSMEVFRRTMSAVQACSCACHLAAFFPAKHGIPDSLDLIHIGLARGCLAWSIDFVPNDHPSLQYLMP